MKFVNTSDKIKLAANDLNPNGKKTILLLHGWPLCSKQFEYQLPALIGAGYRVVMYDMRGFGYSEQATSGYRYNQMADDLYSVIKHFKLDDITLLGFSMGGAIACRYMALEDNAKVSKLILLDAAAPSYCDTDRNPYGQSKQDTEELIELGYRDRPQLNEYFGSIFFDQVQSIPFLNWFQGISDLASGLGEMKALEALRYEDCFDDLKRISVPTLIIHGKQDKICSYNMAELMHESIKGSELVGIDQAGHGAFYEQRDAVNDAILQFLGIF